MKYLITGYTPDYMPIAKVTLPTMEMFAKRHNLELIVNEWSEGSDSSLKIRYAASMLPCIWMDIDVVILGSGNDLMASLIDDGFSFSQDAYGICAGCFSASGTVAYWILKALWCLGNTSRTPDKFEQDAFKVLIESFPKFNRFVKTIPERIISNPETGQIGTFAHHAWANGEKDKHKVADGLKGLL